jgi:hypothetical protein
MRMIAGAILFVGAVGLTAMTVFKSRYSWPDPDKEGGLFFLSLFGFAVGVFGLFLVISGLVAEYIRPARDRE